MMETYAPCNQCAAVNRVRLEQAEKKPPVCARCKQKLTIHGGIVEINDQSFQTIVNKSPLPVVVDFWADWCGPCHAFAPTFAQASKDMQGQYVFAKLDTQNNGQTATNLQIRGIPCLIIFKAGKEVARSSGAMPLHQFKAWLSQALNAS